MRRNYSMKVAAHAITSVCSSLISLASTQFGHSLNDVGREPVVVEFVWAHWWLGQILPDLQQRVQVRLTVFDVWWRLNFGPWSSSGFGFCSDLSFGFWSFCY